MCVVVCCGFGLCRCIVLCCGVRCGVVFCCVVGMLWFVACVWMCHDVFYYDVFLNDVF